VIMDPMLFGIALYLLNDKRKETPKPAPSADEQLVVDGITQRLVGQKATDDERAAVAKEVVAFVRARPGVVRALQEIYRREAGLKVAK